MKLIILNGNDPHRNLAIEEFLLNESKEDIIMLWQNAPTVVIGRNQNAFAEINTEYTDKTGILVARRISGGGAVYHDLGNVNYTFISDRSEEGIDFKTFTAPIIDALASLGVSAALSGRNDIEVDGKKISGNAQHVKGNRVLHHGTLLFDSNLDVLSNALNVDTEKINSKAIKSTRARVINIKELLDSEITVKDFINSIAEFIKTKYGAELTREPESQKIDLLTERNKSREWLYPENGYISKYSIRHKKKHPFGIVEIMLEMKNDVICDVKIIGDFFGIRDISILENSLKGASIKNLSERLNTLNIAEYIYGMTPDDFIAQIK